MTSPLDQKLRIEGLVVITANRLRDGAVIYRTAAGGWSTRLADQEAHAFHGEHDHDHDHEALDRNRHDDRIHAFCYTFDKPLNFEDTMIWLEHISGRHGEDVLRIKGLLNIVGRDAPVAVHGVHYLQHPPVTLARWPDDDRRSRLVFILRDLDRSVIEAEMPK